jgi:hypothetical protein
MVGDRSSNVVLIHPVVMESIAGAKGECEAQLWAWGGVAVVVIGL